MKRLYRIYYSTFDDRAHEEAIKILQEKYGAEVVYHPSRVHPDFRYLELYLDKPGLEDEIAELLRVKLGTQHVKVDWIDTTR